MEKRLLLLMGVPQTETMKIIGVILECYPDFILLVPEIIQAAILERDWELMNGEKKRLDERAKMHYYQQIEKAMLQNDAILSPHTLSAEASESLSRLAAMYQYKIVTLYFIQTQLLSQQNKSQINQDDVFEAQRAFFLGTVFEIVTHDFTNAHFIAYLREIIASMMLK